MLIFGTVAHIKTPDFVPFVGPIPGKKGQYVAAGYNGHGKSIMPGVAVELLLTTGMARIFLTAPALAKYILTSEWDPDMPDSFKITQKRLDKLRTQLDGVKVELARAKL
jgi:hypothetical protein